MANIKDYNKALNEGLPFLEAAAALQGEGLVLRAFGSLNWFIIGGDGCARSHAIPTGLPLRDAEAYEPVPNDRASPDISRLIEGVD